MPVQITIRPKRLAAILAIIILGLTLANIVSQYLRVGLGYEDLPGQKMFDVSGEINIPAWFSSVNLLLSAILLAVIAKASRAKQDGWELQWKILAFIFIYLATDEATGIHEKGGARLASLFVDTEATSGFFYYPWVITGIAVVLIVGVSYLPLLLSLPIRTRLLCILSATFFVGGALGFEMISAKVDTIMGRDNAVYVICMSTEEFLEMAGIALFNYTLADYLARFQKDVTWQLEFVDELEEGKIRLPAKEQSRVGSAS